jgi:hypothetical protein
VQNSTFQNVVVGTNLSLVYLGARSNYMATVPTFKFSGNTVINNTDPEVQIEGNSGSGYYHQIVLKDNGFTGNTGQYDLVFIRNQRAHNDILNNRFYGNTITATTLDLINSGSASIANNWFLQNNANAEVLLQDSASGTIALTQNTIAASPGGRFGVWVLLSGGTRLQSSGNLFYSQYNSKDAWNTPRTDLVANWGNWGVGKSGLTIDSWNAKTPKDGNDSLASLGTTPPQTPP